MKAQAVFLVIILSAIFLSVNFSLAAAGGNAADLETAYNQALQQLVVLLQKQVAILVNQVQNASSTLPAGGAKQASSTPAGRSAASSTHMENYSGSLFNYYPTWHLAPGSCFPSLY